MATFAQIVAARPHGHFTLNTRDQLTVDGELPPDDWKAWIARWFDGEHPAASLVVDADTPLQAAAELVAFMETSVIL